MLNKMNNSWIDEISYKKICTGMSNECFEVSFNNKKYFIKIPVRNNPFINYKDSVKAARLVSEMGVGADLILFDSKTNIGIWRWLSGYRTLESNDFSNSSIFKKIINIIKSMHAVNVDGCLTKNTIFDKAHYCIQNVLSHDIRIEHDHEKYMEFLIKIEEAVSLMDVNWCFCHNDIMAKNIMYDDKTSDLRIIDFDYASCSDPINDFAAISTTECFDNDMDMKYFNNYYSKWDIQKFAKMKLYKVVSDIKWSYWSLHRAVMSKNNYDYKKWYYTKVCRIEEEISSKNISKWLHVIK